MIANLTAGSAVDCHVHVLDPARPSPLKPAADPALPPTAGGVSDLALVLKSHGISNAVLVQPSAYGTDNRVLLSALAASDGRWKGIVTLAPETGAEELAALARAGVVGIRLNLVSHGVGLLKAPGLRQLLDRVRALGWVIQVHTRAAELPECSQLLRECEVRCIIDHLGRPDPSLGLHQMGFRDLLWWVGTGQAIVKLSGAIRCSERPFPHDDITPFVRELIAAAGIGNCIWGSDWPFLNLENRPNYIETLALLERWVPRREDRRRILRDNPARLFGFQTAAAAPADAAAAPAGPARA